MLYRELAPGREQGLVAVGKGVLACQVQCEEGTADVGT